MYIDNLVKAIKSGEISKEENYVFDHMVYVRLFEGCNVFCEHCFIPSNPKKIELSYYENLGLTKDLLNSSNVKPGSKLYLQWHGGEPTMLGCQYLSKAIAEVEKDTQFTYQHGIQTNLVTFHEAPDAWANLYKEKFNNIVGISWDFGIRHLKKSGLNNLQKANADFEKIFWDNIKLAQSYDLNLYMVITVTKKLLQEYRNPLDLFLMLSQKGIKKINFERITKTGMARAHWEQLGLNNLEYADGMSRLFRAYIMFKQNNPDVDLSVSPFDGLLESVIEMRINKSSQSKSGGMWDILSYKNQGYGCWNGSCDTKFHTIDANGYKKGCTALNSEEDNKNKLYQTIDIKTIKWVKRNAPEAVEVPTTSVEEQVNKFQGIRNERQKTCTGCEFISICSSGCLSVEKFDESNHCSGAKNLFKTINTLCEKQGC